MARLRLVAEKNKSVRDLGKKEEVEEDFKLCLVGKALTNSAVHFPSLMNVMAELWYPIKGVTITKIEDKRILFGFYNEIDLRRVIDEMPWFF